MTDIQFQRHLDALSKAHQNYRRHLAACELEYERRYGKSPSDADDDLWIDTFHVVGGTRTVQEVDDGATSYAGLKSYRHNVQVDLPPKKGVDSTRDVIGG